MLIDLLVLGTIVMIIIKKTKHPEWTWGFVLSPIGYFFAALLVFGVVLTVLFGFGCILGYLIP